MKTLREILNEAKLGKVAIGHFNISDSTQFNGIVAAAAELKVPVVIGVSGGEEQFIGMENAVALVLAAQKQGKEVYLNADHHHTVESCKAAIDAGFDSVIFDGVQLPLEENIAKTKEVVEYARDHEAKTGHGVIVEAELGYIGTSSKVLDTVPDGVLLDNLPTPQDAKDFVEATGVDALAPAVGNLHGMLKGMHNPSLQIELIQQMREVLPDTHFVLHGGSGLQDSDFTEAIKAGMNCVHINTEIRRAYRKGIEQALKEDPTQIAPYKYLNSGRDALQKVVKERLELFSQ